MPGQGSAMDLQINVLPVYFSCICTKEQHQTSREKLQWIPWTRQANYNKKFSGRQSDHQRHINFAMKKDAKMVNRYGHLYLVNQTMQDKLKFLLQALSP